MVGTLIIGLGAILVLMSLSNRNSKLITYLMYLFIWIVYTFCNSGNPDLDVYTWTYSNHIYVTAPGFDLLMKLFANLGIPFFVFKGFCGLFVLYFYRLTFKKFYRNENAVLAMCVLCPLIASVSQIRNGMMAAYVLYAFSEFLFDERHRLLPYIIRISLISILIHPVGLVYLVLIFAKKNFKDEGRTKLIFSIMLIIVVELILTQNLLYNIAGLFIKNTKYLTWFDFASGFAAVNEETLNIKGKLLPVIEQLAGTGLLVFTTRKYSNRYHLSSSNKVGDDITVPSLEQLQILKNTFFLLLFVLPFYQISPTYFRIYMNFIPVLYIVILLMFCECKKKASLPRNVLFWITTVYGLLITVLSSVGYTLSMFESFRIG